VAPLPVEEGFLMQVFVRDNDINSALRVLKKKMQRERAPSAK
jgi:ribosomal protein S21